MDFCDVCDVCDFWLTWLVCSLMRVCFAILTCWVIFTFPWLCIYNQTYTCLCECCMVQPDRLGGVRGRVHNIKRSTFCWRSPSPQQPKGTPPTVYQGPSRQRRQFRHAISRLTEALNATYEKTQSGRAHQLNLLQTQLQHRELQQLHF